MIRLYSYQFELNDSLNLNGLFIVHASYPILIFFAVETFMQHGMAFADFIFYFDRVIAEVYLSYRA